MDRKRETADGFEVRTDLALEERESLRLRQGMDQLRSWGTDCTALGRSPSAPPACPCRG